MKDFLQWANENQLDLSTDAAESQPTTSEDKIRTGIKFGYPDAYAMQYPDAYYAAHSATAFLDLQNRKQQRSVKGGADTAAN